MLLTAQSGFEGRICDLIVSVPDHCLSFYFKDENIFETQRSLSITFYSELGEWRIYIQTKDQLIFTAHLSKLIIRTASSEFVTYRLCEQRRFRRACASAQSRQNLRCSLIQAVSQEEPSDRIPDLWPL